MKISITKVSHKVSFLETEISHKQLANTDFKVIDLYKTTAEYNKYLQNTI